VASTGYRYGFNGQENDPETVGTGNGTQDYGMRIYNPSLGRFLSMDPIAKIYPHYTPYQFAGNSPITYTDLDGLEKYHYIRFQDRNGNTILGLSEIDDIVTKVHSVEIHSTSIFGMTISYPTIVYTNYKNIEQEYYVWDIDEYGQYNYDFVPGPYEEHAEFSSYEEAQNVVDDDFVFTSEDALFTGVQGAINTMHAIESRAIGKYLRKGSSGSRAINEWHHLIPKSLAKASNFVKKAVAGGFSIDGKMNLTPLAKYFKSTGLGVHAKHPKYTAQINNYLNGLDITGFTENTAATFLGELNDYILNRIKDSPKVKLNDLDLKLNEFKPK